MDFNFGNDLSSHAVTSFEDCCNRCHEDQQCRGFSYVPQYGRCWFKTEPFVARAANGVISGRNSGTSPPTTSTRTPPPSGNWRPGKVTVYGDDVGGGACGFNTGSHLKPAAQSRFFAIASDQYNDGLGCGQCAVMRMPGHDQGITMMATNLCPECHSGHQDLSNDGFYQLTGVTTGVIGMEYQFILCPDEFVSGDIQVFMKEGSNPWWVAVQPRNMKQPVSGMQISVNGGHNWYQLPVTAVSGLYFKYESQNLDHVLQGTYHLKIQTQGRPDIVAQMNGVTASGTVTIHGKQN